MEVLKFSEFISEKKSVKKFVPKDNISTAKDLNKGYNWSAFPEDSRSDDKWYAYVYKNEIPIGDPDPVKKFKEWRTEYWKKEDKL